MSQGGGHSVCEAVPVLVKDCARSAVGGQGGGHSVCEAAQGLCHVTNDGSGRGHSVCEAVPTRTVSGQQWGSGRGHS